MRMRNKHIAIFFRAAIVACCLCSLLTGLQSRGNIFANCHNATGCKSDTTLRLLYNKVKQQVRFYHYSPGRMNAGVIILNNKKNVAKTDTVLLIKGDNNITLPLHTLANGKYVLKLIIWDTGEVSSGIFIKRS